MTYFFEVNLTLETNAKKVTWSLKIIREYSRFRFLILVNSRSGCNWMNNLLKTSPNFTVQVTMNSQTGLG